MRERQQVVSLAAMREPSLLRFYVSREWLNKFNTFAEPGPITNHTFLCSHGGEAASPAVGVRGARGRALSSPSPLSSSPGIPPNKYHYIDDLVVMLPQNVWEHVYSRFVPGRLLREGRLLLAGPGPRQSRGGAQGRRPSARAEQLGSGCEGPSGA